MSARPRVLEFEVIVDRDRVARSALGGSPLPREAEWWAEHLVLAGLVRCTLASMDYAARRAGLNSVGSGQALGTVTKREDGLYAFVDIETTPRSSSRRPLTSTRWESSSRRPSTAAS